MRRVCKSFGGQRALDHVDFELRAGEVHVLAGQNGAGKSTLMRILAGAVAPDAGEIIVAGRPRRFATPRRSAAAGVAVIHQELSLVAELSVVDNLFLGREPSRLGWLNRAKQTAEAERTLGRLNLTIDVRRRVGDYSIAVRQLIEIGKALLLDAPILVMDEPTAALREPEVRRLFACLAELLRRGRGIVYITHRLEEIYQIAHRITVLRDGRWIVTGPVEHIPAPALIHHMVGRDEPRASPRPAEPEPLLGPERRRAPLPIDDPEPNRPSVEESIGAARTTPRLRLTNVTLRSHRNDARSIVERVSFALHPGEIVGLAGVEGSGVSALLHALYGDYSGRLTGTIELDGAAYRPGGVRKAIAHGIALVTNDRQRSGLVQPMSALDNLSLASLPRVSPGGWIRAAQQRARAEPGAALLGLRAIDLRRSVATLSGGNQQKVVLGKWLGMDPRVLLLDEPTRGVDVGSRHDIYGLIRHWASAGAAVLVVSPELPELLALSDRILVMHRGSITAGYPRSQATPERILQAAMGGG